MNNDTFDRAARESAMFTGLEFSSESLDVFLQIRFPDLSDEDRKILVDQFLAEN